MSNTPAPQASASDLASAASQQVLATLSSQAGAALGVVAGATLAQNAQAVSGAAGKAALAALQVPAALNIMNSVYQLAQIGTMSDAQVLEYLHGLSDNIRAHQAALDNLDPQYAAKIPEANLPPASVAAAPAVATTAAPVEPAPVAKAA